MHRFGGHLSRGAELGAEAAAVPGGDRGDARSSEGGSEGEPSEQQNAGRTSQGKFFFYAPSRRSRGITGYSPFFSGTSPPRRLVSSGTSRARRAPANERSRRPQVTL